MRSVTLGELGTVLDPRRGRRSAVDDHFAWRGTFSSSKGYGDIVNGYNRDQTYTNTDRVSGRVQFLLTPSTRLQRAVRGRHPAARQRDHQRPHDQHADADDLFERNATNLTTDASTRLAQTMVHAERQLHVCRQLSVRRRRRKTVNNDAARGLVTGSNGTSAGAELEGSAGNADLHHRVQGLSLQRRQRRRHAVRRLPQLRRLLERLHAGQPGAARQLAAPAISSTTRPASSSFECHNDADYQHVWGNDAGAWFANPTQYTRLDTDAAGRFLLQKSLADLSMSFNSPTGTQHIRNKSCAPFAQANWHLAHALDADDRRAAER